ncbi:hypothetical protein QJS10_CPB15g01551 [Acorus calamus]|uniref:Uncharacterized protein n=1 Tax=Acorus calamus TaxID=4465 RepID=A0AAV9D7X9_ACOCL|nr:hypothetical protein QJS10_CPB15g01549 [Acorus calamus]KAK1297315.1 hypothetical protein QJS10_CPB15g01551 [Acorus calamus]
MLRFLAAVARSLMRPTRKGSRVVDESAFRGGGDGGDEAAAAAAGGGGGGGLSLLSRIARAPLHVISCMAHADDVDLSAAVWASGELSRPSDLDYLMVRDSMRYAIYV